MSGYGKIVSFGFDREMSNISKKELRTKLLPTTSSQWE